jgi:hypothetical protein
MPRGVACIVLAGVLAAAAKAAEPERPNRFALLVGCSRYPGLAESRQLRGPANDVVLLRSVLMSRFGFPESGVVTLSEHGAPGLQPTRANIERAFRDLAARAQKGDQIVILMAGHGSQQPDGTPSPDDPEPDGLDEIFLPADVGNWDGQAGTVKNAIVDDELRVWLVAITSKGASVWIIMDACHSGTMTRGGGEEVLRQVPPEELVPVEAIEKARKRALSAPEQTRGGPGDDAPVDASSALSGLVALYAAQSTEPTVEKLLPPESAGAKPYGLLTYTISELLSETAAPITYSELVDRIHQQYVQWGRSFPTPSIEGGDRDREVLGTARWPGRSRILLARDDQGAWKLNAGAILGLTVGSVLEVRPPAGQAGGDTVLGHVRIVSAGALESVVEPTRFGDKPMSDKLLIGGRCEVVYRNYAVRRLLIALDSVNTGASADAEIGAVRAALQKLGAGENSLFETAHESARADWLVRLEGGKAFLVPASGWAASMPGLREAASEAKQPPSPTYFGPTSSAPDVLVPWLEERLNRIARVQNLLALAAPEGTALDPDASVQIKLELVRYRDRSDMEGKPIAWQSTGRRLQAGDLVGFRVWNRGKTAVDVTLLFVDSGFGIKPWFPRPGTVGDNRVPPGQSVPGPRARVSATTVGLEHMIAIAVEAQSGQQPIDFSCLAQPTIESIRTRGIDQPLESPLGRLFKQALYSQGGTRGLDAAEVDRHAVRVISWQVVGRGEKAKE